MVIRKYEQRRRAEAAEETRRRLLDAVYEQLRAAPAEPISIDRIARTADVARSTVYVVFGSRAGLFAALGEDLLQRAGSERMLRQSRQSDAIESLRAGVHELAAMYAAERDVIRALVGYALAQDAIGLARFREKYAPLMSGDDDRAAFETASQPADANTAEFAPIAKMAASVDTLDGFLREMRARFPDATARATLPPEIPKADAVPTGSLPDIVGLKRAEAAR